MDRCHFQLDYFFTVSVAVDFGVAVIAVLPLLLPSSSSCSFNLHRLLLVSSGEFQSSSFFRQLAVFMLDIADAVAVMALDAICTTGSSHSSNDHHQKQPFAWKSSSSAGIFSVAVSPKSSSRWTNSINSSPLFLLDRHHHHLNSCSLLCDQPATSPSSLTVCSCCHFCGLVLLLLLLRVVIGEVSPPHLRPIQLFR